jgi:hypothetical protein
MRLIGAQCLAEARIIFETKFNSGYLSQRSDVRFRDE